MLIENTIPVLAVADLERSIAFYQRVLGFNVEWHAGPICSVARDAGHIMLQEREQVAPSTVWIGVESDSIFSGIEQSGAEVIQGPCSQPWAYEMKIADPDGNILWLGAEPKAS
ncbi:MAG: VOC family protein [Planctomycetales bacterium]|nr:VOC family protein [Planctomycetales bacterium]